MQNFIVLGYIPGTNYQTSFAFWLYVSAGFVSLLLLPRLVRRLISTYHHLASTKSAAQFEQLELISM